MIRKYIKTNHFWQRAWERGYNQCEVDNLLLMIDKRVKSKTLLIFGKSKLRAVGHKVKGSTHLVIVVKNNVLITLFEVPDLFGYLKANFSKYSLYFL
jgi:hypothetical protein